VPQKGRGHGHRHVDEALQHRTLCKKLRGHYQYYAVRFNYRALKRTYLETVRAWKYWLGRRSNVSTFSWVQFQRFLVRFPLPEPVILHKW